MVDGGDAIQRRCFHLGRTAARGGALECPCRADGRVSLSAGRNTVRAGFHGDRGRVAPARHGCAAVDRLRRRGFGMAARSPRPRDALCGYSRMTGLLRATNLRVAYGDVPVLDGVDLTLARGEFVALIGPNGAGKTTLLRTIAGIAPLDGGHIDLDGHDLASAPRSAKQAIGLAIDPRSEERRVGKSVDLGGRRIIKKKKKKEKQKSYKKIQCKTNTMQQDFAVRTTN